MQNKNNSKFKKIAITQRIIQNKSYPETREALDIRWGKLLYKLDLLPVVLPYGVDFQKYEFDGVILSGGNDLGEISFRDEYEYNLIKYCLQRGIPILGVCRGMQVINGFFGGSLKKVRDQVGIEHGLIVNDDSKYASLLNNLSQVNSYHTYGIDKLGEGLQISAWNEDKTVIKAIEHKTKKILGIMWHSEREEPFRKEELELIDGFFS